VRRVERLGEEKSSAPCIAISLSEDFSQRASRSWPLLERVRNDTRK
jgi:hypothetical protein